MSDIGPVEQWIATQIKQARTYTFNEMLDFARAHDAEDAEMREFLRESRERIGHYVNTIVDLRAALRAQTRIVHETGHARHITLDKCEMPACRNARAVLAAIEALEVTA